MWYIGRQFDSFKKFKALIQKYEQTANCKLQYVLGKKLKKEHLKGFSEKQKLKMIEEFVFYNITFYCEHAIYGKRQKDDDTRKRITRLVLSYFFVNFLNMLS